MRDPQISVAVFRDRIDISAGYAAQGDEVSSVVEIAEPRQRSDPDSAMTILKTARSNRAAAILLPNLIGHRPFAFPAGLPPQVHARVGRDQWSIPASRSRYKLALVLTQVPSVPICEDGPHAARDTLPRRIRHGPLAHETIDAVHGRDPDVSFAVFEQPRHPSSPR